MLHSGPWIHYALPVPWNAGQHNRGWSFTLTVQFPPLPSIPPAFRVYPPRRSDFTLSLQGEPVRHNLYLSDTSLVVEMDIEIDPKKLTLTLLPELSDPLGVPKVMPFGGEVRVSIGCGDGTLAEAEGSGMSAPQIVYVGAPVFVCRGQPL